MKFEKDQLVWYKTPPYSSHLQKPYYKARFAQHTLYKKCVIEILDPLHAITAFEVDLIPFIEPDTILKEIL